MAEARVATDIYYVQKDKFNIGLSWVDGFVHVNFWMPTPRTAIQWLALTLRRARYDLQNRIWPATPTTLVLVMTGFAVGAIKAKPGSWMRSGWRGKLARVVWAIDSVLGKLNPLHKRFSTRTRVIYLACTTSFIGMLIIVALERLLLRSLLSWKGWLHMDRHARKSKVVALWGALVRLLSGPKNLTYAFQMSLPSLPLPDLEDTCKFYLNSVAPLLSADEYAKTLDLCEKFLQNEGPSLQRYLWFKHLYSSNYVSDWWEKYVYLRTRTPLMINSNYYVMDARIVPLHKEDPDPQIYRAASLLSHMLVFKDMIAEENLPPMTLRGTVPLCMAQYARMFGTTRVPGRGCDELVHSKTRYVIIMRKGRFYKLNVYHGVNGTQLEPYSAEDIATQLKLIVDHADRKAFTTGGSKYENNPSSLSHRVQSHEDLVLLQGIQQGQIQNQIQNGTLGLGLGLGKGRSSSSSAQKLGTVNRTKFTSKNAAETKPGLITVDDTDICAFTAGPRSRWAEIREVYFSEGRNRKALRTIEKSALVVSLDHEDYPDTNARAKSLFHGSANGTNRWFDKSLTLVVYPNGYAGLNVEHSWADAPAVAHMWEFVLLEELREFEEQGGVYGENEPNQAPESSNNLSQPLGLGSNQQNKKEIVEQDANLDPLAKPSDKAPKLATDNSAPDPEPEEEAGGGTGGTASMDAPFEGSPFEAAAPSLSYASKRNLKHNGRFIRKPAERRLRPPTQLVFDLDSDLIAACMQAKALAKSIITDLDLDIICYQNYGKAFIKHIGISPDAYVQMALQLAYFNDTDRFDLTYEASMTRLFRFGRTETVRSLTHESIAFVRCMKDSTATPKAKFQALRRAARKHQQSYRKAMTGMGVDRHLFSLYVVCKGMDVESDFLNAALSIPWRLSTSQQPQEQTLLRRSLSPQSVRNYLSPGGGFGPVADDGYGVSYMVPGQYCMFFHVSSKISSRETDSKRFSTNIASALDTMKETFHSFS